MTVMIPYIVPLDMKGCICHFVKWQIHPFISKGTIDCALANTIRVSRKPTLVF